MQVPQRLRELRQLIVGHVELREVRQAPSEGVRQATQPVVGQVQHSQVAQLVERWRHFLQLIATGGINYLVISSTY